MEGTGAEDGVTMPFDRGRRENALRSGETKGTGGPPDRVNAESFTGA